MHKALRTIAPILSRVLSLLTICLLTSAYALLAGLIVTRPPL
jgi:hypothetical protein